MTPPPAPDHTTRTERATANILAGRASEAARIAGRRRFSECDRLNRRVERSALGRLLDERKCLDCPVVFDQLPSDTTSICQACYLGLARFEIRRGMLAVAGLGIALWSALLGRSQQRST